MSCVRFILGGSLVIIVFIMCNWYVWSVLMIFIMSFIVVVGYW